MTIGSPTASAVLVIDGRPAHRTAGRARLQPSATANIRSLPPTLRIRPLLHRGGVSPRHHCVQTIVREEPTPDRPFFAACALSRAGPLGDTRCPAARSLARNDALEGFPPEMFSARTSL